MHSSDAPNANYPPAPPSAAAPGMGLPASLSIPLNEAWGKTTSYLTQLSQPLETENAAVSPAAYAARAPGWTRDKPIVEHKLGRRIDGWADTAVGMADHAPLLIQAFVGNMPSHLNARTYAVSTRLGVTGLGSAAHGIEIPFSPRGLFRILASVGPAIAVLPRAILQLFGLEIIGRQRDYLFTAMTPGAAVGVNISATGRDLYIAWDLFVRRVWNELAIGLVALVALIIGVLAGIGGVQAIKHTFDATTTMSAGAFVGGFLLAGIGSFLGMLVVLMILGAWLRDDVLAALVKDIDFFEAHDVQAMVISVDKALREAADKAGIDIAKLRLKETYRTGRRGRVI